MNRIKLLTILTTFAIFATFMQVEEVRASNGEEYITISVDAWDDNGNLKYALDTDDPSAFTDSNEFTIPAGTSHTIYVKDMAGNITSQTYSPSQTNPIEANENEQKINIDLEIGGNRESGNINYSDYEYLTDDPIESGTGTVAEKIKTDGSDSAEKIFYTLTTKDGDVLYLIIDQGRSSDNVYLLDTVTASDLLALADGAGSSQIEKEDDSLLAALQSKNENETETTNSNEKKAKTNNNFIIVFFIIAVVGGAYYYLNIYKKKKDESMDMVDAMDMDDFEPEEDEEEEVDFENDENERYLEELLNEEEDTSLYDADPEVYAMSHMDDDYDTGAEIPDFEEDEEGEDI